jgi:hypothetical protein
MTVRYYPEKIPKPPLRLSLSFSGLGLLLVILKLAGEITWSWWIVLLPFYFWWAAFFVAIVGAVVCFIVLPGIFLGVLYVLDAANNKYRSLKKRIK